MRENRKKITKLLSCLVAVGILLSALPGASFAEKALDSCHTYEWYTISSNGETYTVDVVTKAPISNLDQNPLSQTDPIEAIYIVDGQGNLLTDEALAKNLIIDAQSSARFIKMDSWRFAQSISSSDLYAETRTDYSRKGYLVIGPAYTADFWRDMFLYSDTILPPPLPSLKGLDNYDHRVEIWGDVILDAALQPDLYDDLEDNPQLQQDLSDLHDALVFAGYDYEISNIILQGEGTFRLKPKEIQTTLNNWGKVSAHAKMMKHLDKLGKAFAVAGVGVQIFEITGDANRMFVLHALANARAEERLEAIGEFIKANEDELDPALVSAYDNARHNFDDIYEKYYDDVGNLIRSAIQSDRLVDLGFTTTSLYAAFKSTALGKVLLPYYLSWEVYKGLRDKNEKVQRLTMAATLQRHLASQTTVEGLETLKSDLASSNPKNKDSIETALVLYNINQYLGWYFYHNYYEVLDDLVFGSIQDFFTGGQLSDYLNHLDSNANLDKANCIQTQKPYLLTEFDFYGWHDYSWLISNLAYFHFKITASPEKDRYEPGETAKVTGDIKNIGDKKNFWLGVSFKDPTGETSKYDPQIVVTPQSASIDPCERKTFGVEWTIPDDVPLGQYEIAVNCWKDATFTEKYTDDLDWVPIFEVSDIIVMGLEWLRTQRKVDGNYVYWTYQGTPNVGITALVTLAFLNHGYDESDPTVKGALNWLVAQANEDGSISHSGNRFVYDTSLAILPLVAANDNAKYGDMIENAKDYLISVQTTEGTGCMPPDRYYGGWSYRKENRADLSNSQFALMALEAAGGLIGDVKKNALTFVTRCQNRKESNAEYSTYDDGGFVYQPKSGAESWGSMTAAGLWGLFLCGVDKNDGRVQDALKWLDARSVEKNDPKGNTWVYYYNLGLAKAYLMAEANGCDFEHKDWYEDLYAFLCEKQEADGHWPNIEGGSSSDVLATAEAILALEVKEVSEKYSRLSYIVFKLRSAADLHIYDPEGRHVGLNTETGEVEIGIPDATYTENPIEIKVPNLDAGGYKAVLIGTEAGEYELEVVAKTGNKTLAEASYDGWITEGATQEMITTISSIVGPVDVRLGTLKAVVEAEDGYSEHFSLDAGDELEIDAIDETGVLLRIEAEEDCEGEVKIRYYSENPTIKGFPSEYKYCALEKYVDISLDVDREKIDWPIYLEVHYDKDELPENVDETTLIMYHYGNDTKWRSCNDFEVNPEENYISAELEEDELCYFGMGGLYAPIWVRYTMILIVIAIVIVLALGYFSVRRFAKSRRVKAMKVPERVPAEVAITIYNFDNSFSLLKEREETAKILDGLDGRLASGEIKEETYIDLNSKYKSKIGDLNRKMKSDLERAKAYLLRIEDEQIKLQGTREILNAELQKETGRKKRAEISAKVAGISAELDRVDGIIKTMKEKIGVIEWGGLR